MMKPFDDEHLGYIRDCIEYTKRHSRQNFEAASRVLQAEEFLTDSDSADYLRSCVLNHMYTTALKAEEGLNI
jgi:hypothetical protein